MENSLKIDRVFKEVYRMRMTIGKLEKEKKILKGKIQRTTMKESLPNLEGGEETREKIQAKKISKELSAEAIKGEEDE